MQICHIGLNHKTAPVDLRERAAVPEQDIGSVLDQLIEKNAIREVALLSTCNRVEFTVVTHDPDAAMAEVHEWFSSRSNLPLGDVSRHLYSLQTDAAVTHLFAVASGLDSLVLGEPQILGQVKSAYEHALTAKTAGHVLHRMYQATFSAAKKARSKTNIGRQSVNVSSCAVELAKRIFGDLAGKTVMLISAGEMAELAATHLMGHGVKEILVANRTLERAQNLAMKYEGHAFTLEDMPSHLDRVDIVISSTGASTYVLLPDMIKKAMSKRASQPMFLVDIAVPRDIDPRIGDIDGVYLYGIDDLQDVVDSNKESRMQEAERAKVMLKEDEQAFLRWLKSLESVPLIRQIQDIAEQLRVDELAKVDRQFKGLNDEQRDAMERFSRALMRRFLHSSLKTLKALPDDMEGDLLMGAAKRLFSVDSNDRQYHKLKRKSDDRSSG